MSMLAERRRKTKWVINPTKKPIWTTDSEGIKLGKQLMEKMGWSAGKGLGANEQGIQEPLRVSYKNDTKGMGFKGNDDDWIEYQDEFNSLLSQLSNNNSSQPAEAGKTEIKSLEEKSKLSRARVHYQKFTRGKDLSRYSETDLACILGINNNKKVKNSSEEKSQTEQKTENNYETSFGVTTINSGSLQDYFKKKWLTNKSKENNNSSNDLDSESKDDFNNFEEGETTERKKSKKRKCSELNSEIEELSESKTVNPPEEIKNFCDIEVEEETKKQRKSKKKKKKDDLEAEPEKESKVEKKEKNECSDSSAQVEGNNQEGCPKTSDNENDLDKDERRNETLELTTENFDDTNLTKKRKKDKKKPKKEELMEEYCEPVEEDHKVKKKKKKDKEKKEKDQNEVKGINSEDYCDENKYNSSTKEGCDSYKTLEALTEDSVNKSIECEMIPKQKKSKKRKHDELEDKDVGLLENKSTEISEEIENLDSTEVQKVKKHKKKKKAEKLTINNDKENQELDSVEDTMISNSKNSESENSKKDKKKKKKIKLDQSKLENEGEQEKTKNKSEPEEAESEVKVSKKSKLNETKKSKHKMVNEESNDDTNSNQNGDDSTSDSFSKTEIDKKNSSLAELGEGDNKLAKESKSKKEENKTEGSNRIHSHKIELFKKKKNVPQILDSRNRNYSQNKMLNLVFGVELEKFKGTNLENISGYGMSKEIKKR